MRVVLVAAAAAVGLAAGHLPEKDRMAVGYNDGYAFGYAAACEIEADELDGEWRSVSYSEGFASGVTDGVQACLAR